jgi:hypothetical protein
VAQGVGAEFRPHYHKKKKFFYYSSPDPILPFFHLRIFSLLSPTATSHPEDSGGGIWEKAEGPKEEKKERS